MQNINESCIHIRDINENNIKLKLIFKTLHLPFHIGVLYNVLVRKAFNLLLHKTV